VTDGIKWESADKDRLADALGVLALVQKSYGRIVEIKPTIKAWEWIMAKEYTVNQVLYAMETYMKSSPDMPAPSDLIKIINPPQAKISEFEYRQAYKQWELSGFPQFSYEWSVVNDYRKQNEIAPVRQVYQVLNTHGEQKEIDNG